MTAAGVMVVMILALAVLIIANRSTLHPRRVLQLAWSIRQAPFDTVIIGDSITEIAATPETCRSRTFNAGIPGYTAERYRLILPLLAGPIRGKKVVIALGSNESRPGNGTIAEFASAYRKLLSVVPGRVTGLVLVPPFANGAKMPDQARRREINGIILRIAGYRELNVASVQQMQTYDGLHPSSWGSLQWRRAVRRVC